MKALALIGSLVVVGLGSSAISKEPSIVNKENAAPMFISCITFPWCGGTDSATPILDPKDPKTDSQDAKDEKVA